MKAFRIYGMMIFILVAVVCLAHASDFKAKPPMLITAAGQSADALMVKILAQKNNIAFVFEKLATPDMLKGNASLILVTGGSTKGLGAAKIDKNQELQRVDALIKAARTANMKIITMHVGGKARRGKLSDEFNKLSAENADYIIAVQGGDDDKFFSDIASQKKIPLKYIDKIMDAGTELKSIFSEDK